MKKFILSIFLIITAFISKGQTVLAEQKGVSLYYTEQYVNTIECSGTKYNQYKIVAYLSNRSGHSVDSENSWISHNGWATSCGNMVETAYLNEKINWPDQSVQSYTYYVAIKEGEALSINTWRLGAFRLRN